MTTKAAAAQAVTAPVVAQKAPYEIDVEVGKKYAWYGEYAGGGGGWAACA